jgi:hypothetical protein
MGSHTIEEEKGLYKAFTQNSWKEMSPEDKALWDAKALS